MRRSPQLFLPERIAREALGAGSAGAGERGVCREPRLRPCAWLRTGSSVSGSPPGPAGSPRGSRHIPEAEAGSGTEAGTFGGDFAVLTDGSGSIRIPAVRGAVDVPDRDGR